MLALCLAMGYNQHTCCASAHTLTPTNARTLLLSLEGKASPSTVQSPPSRLAPDERGPMQRATVDERGCVCVCEMCVTGSVCPQWMVGGKAHSKCVSA